MKAQKLLILLIITASGFIQSCRQDTEKYSTSSALNQPLECSESHFCIPIKISLEDIELKLESSLKKVLLNKKKIDSRTKLTVTRLGRARLSGVGGRLLTRIPLKVIVYKKKLIDLPPVVFELDVNILSNIRVEPDWNVTSSSQLARYVWRKDPKMEVLGLSINLKSQVEKFLDAEKENITQAVDRAVFKKVNLKKVVNRTWRNIQKEKNLLKAEDETLILKIKPSSVSLIGCDIYSREIEVNLRVDAKMIVSSKSVQRDASISDIPELIRKVDSCSGMDVKILTKVQFKDISSSLNKHLKDYNVNILGMEYNFDDLKIAYHDPFLYLELQVRGDEANGVIGANMTFGMDTLQKKFDFEIQEVKVITGDLKLSIAAMLLDYYVQNQLITYEGFEYQHYLDQLPYAIEQAVEKGRSGKIWHPEFDTLDSRITQLSLHKGGLDFILSTRGNGSVVIDSLIPKSSKHRH